MPDNTIAGFRLSAQQERVWTHQQGGAAFGARCTVVLEGSLDPVKLQEALGSLVQRHEILRTVFHRQPGLKLPFQVIREKGSFAWEAVDFQNLDEFAQAEKIERFFHLAAFNLEEGPMLRVLLATHSLEKHTLFLHLPALSADPRSLQNLIVELGSAYAAALQGKNLSDDVMQYADVVQWQSELLESEDTKAGRDFWRDYCRQIDFPALTASSLPQESKTEPAEFSPAVLTVALDPKITESFAGSAANLLLACWSAIQCRLTGRSDVTVGVAFDGRKYEELEGAIGLFARHLPLRFQIEPASTFAVLLRKTNELVGEAHQWQESFDWSLIDGSSDSAGPLLPLSFEYTELAGKQTYGEVSFTVAEQYACWDRFKLKLAAVRTAVGLRLEFHYDSSRFDRKSIEQLSGYFQTLLRAAVEKPETRVDRLPLLTEAERQQLLVEWNQTAAAYPGDQCLHQLFESQAVRTPDRPAVRFNDKQLTYRELNEAANQLAHYLRSLGVKPDSVVGLCVERSAEMMVALLAILKASGAYVPLNPDNPKPRLAQQLAGCVALITEQKLLAQMPEFPGKTLALDRDQQLWSSQPRTNPVANTTPENLVYVIYTSGSTGIPKGVAVRHRNLVNYSHFITRRLDLDQHPDGLHFATVSTIGADLGNTCIYPSLISGGCLHVIAYEVSTDAQRFGQYTQQHPIDVLKIVPSHLQALLHSSDAGQVLPRKYLITGGETLTPKLIEKIQSLSPGCAILNHYGPTETTVGSLTLLLKDYDWKNASATSIPIGRPIANTQVYILDEHLEPVPSGVVGELYISGAGVTAGYLNQPERTAERFLRNPFVSDANAKMYRTGDLARYLSDGNVEFLGRGDDQVKIRGFRIELGEIESVLTQRAGVKQAVVLAKEDALGEKRLVAYVVASREQDLTSENLRAYLKEQLPDYMVPSAIVLLPKLPLTSNGKIDRKALPEPEQVQTKAYVAPRTPTEEVVANIWAEVLRRDKISIEGNFFDLGGHSLLATQVISRVREHFHVELAMKILFEQPTVAGLAEAITSAQQSGTDEADSAIVPVGRDAYRAGRS